MNSDGSKARNSAYLLFYLALIFFRKKHEKSATITSLAWNPSNNGELAMADKNGFIGLLEGIDSSLNKVRTSDDRC